MKKTTIILAVILGIIATVIILGIVYRAASDAGMFKTDAQKQAEFDVNIDKMCQDACLGLSQPDNLMCTCPVSIPNAPHVYIEATVLDKCMNLSARERYSIMTTKGTLSDLPDCHYEGGGGGPPAMFFCSHGTFNTVQVNGTYLFETSDGVIINVWAVETAMQYCELRQHLDGVKPCQGSETK